MSERTQNRDHYGTLYPVINFGLRRKYDVQASGLENIPEQPALYVANHERFADSIAIAAVYSAATKQPMRFAAKQEYFDGKGLDGNGKFGRITKWFFTHTDMIPVERDGKNPRSFKRLQDDVKARIDDGDSVVFHAEGTRTPDDLLYKFRSGAARIAIALSVPTVPVGIDYHDEPGTKTKLDIMFGEPIAPGEYTQPPYDGLSKPRKAELLSDTLESRVAAMTGKQRAGVFAELHEHQK